MKRSEIKIETTLGEVMDAPLIGSWQYICDKYGLNEWCINAGMADKNDNIGILLEDAEHIGIITED